MGAAPHLPPGRHRQPVRLAAHTVHAVIERIRRRRRVLRNPHRVQVPAVILHRATADQAEADQHLLTTKRRQVQSLLLPVGGIVARHFGVARPTRPIVAGDFHKPKIPVQFEAVQLPVGEQRPPHASEIDLQGGRGIHVVGVVAAGAVRQAVEAVEGLWCGGSPGPVQRPRAIPALQTVRKREVCHRLAPGRAIDHIGGSPIMETVGSPDQHAVIVVLSADIEAGVLERERVLVAEGRHQEAAQAHVGTGGPVDRVEGKVRGRGSAPSEPGAVARLCTGAGRHRHIQRRLIHQNLVHLEIQAVVVTAVLPGQKPQRHLAVVHVGA